MNIDFKGYKYAVVTIQGGVLCRCYEFLEAYYFYENNVHPYKIIKNPDYKEEKQMENVYTKQSYDVGETPIKGNFVGILSDKSEVVIYGQIIADTKSFVILLDADNGEWVFNKDEFQYRPYLTDREKAIDDLSKYVFNNPNSTISVPHNVFSAIKSGKVHGVTFTENKND